MSEIKVNKLTPRTNCGTVTLGDSGDTITISAGADATLGGAGSTITIPAGATITNSGTANGFGATGAVNWQPGDIKTSGFTATGGEGYFVDTTSGPISVNLPAGTAGLVVGVADYANNFGNNSCTLVQNGSDKISGSTFNAIISTNGVAVTLVFVDSTKGWIITDSGSQADANTKQYVAATGGCITTCGDYKIHTFLSPNTFTVTNAGNADGSDTVDYFVVAGGGGGGRDNFGANRMGSGGGAGGFRLSNSTCMPAPHTSPLANPTGIAVPATPYPIQVGGGGVGGTSSTGVTVCGAVGTPSIFSTITSAGGGGGQGHNSGYGICTPNPHSNCNNGGSGGGIGENFPNPGGRGTGNDPVTNPPQGNPSGASFYGPTLYFGTGAGGASAPGGNSSQPNGGAGGAGSYVVQNNVTATTFLAGCNGTPGPVSGARYFAGGGGSHPSGAGGTGGGAAGAQAGTNAGTPNTGGGGGGARSADGGQGGSGIVIIRYKYQN